MAEENNIGASRLLGTNGLQQAVDSLANKVNQMGGDIGKLVSSLTAMTGAFNRSTGGSSGGSWNNNSNRSQYGANGGGGRFGGGYNGYRNGGGGSFGMLGAGSRLSAGASAAFGVASAITDYGNRNMSTMMQQNFAGNQSAMYGGNYSTSNVTFGMRQQMATVYGSLNATDQTAGFYYNQYTFGNSQFNGQANPAFTRGNYQVGGFAYGNPTLGQAAVAQAAMQSYTPRASMVAQAYGMGPTIGAGGARTSMGQIAEGLYRRTFGNQRISMQQLNAATMLNGSLNANVTNIGSAMGLSAQSQQAYLTMIKGQVAAQNAGINANDYYNLMSQASTGNKQAMATLKKAGIGATAFEAQRNLTASGTIRQEDVNESMSQAFIKTTDVVNRFSQALTQLMKSTGMDKMLGTSAGILSPISNSLGGFSGAFGAMGGIMAASRFFGGGGGLLGGLRGGFGGMGGGGAAAAGGSSTLTATAGADGIFSVTGLGAGGGLLSGGAATAGGVGLAGAGVLGAGALGWNQGVGRNRGGILGALGTTLKGTPFSPFGAAYLGASMGHRALNWMRGSNKESFWSLFNPWGQAKPSGAAVSGGGSADTPGGGSVGNGSSNVGANAAQIIKLAETQLGVPYVWGGETAGRAMDCSGLTQWAYGQAGVKIPRVAADQQSQAPMSVPVNQTQPGDLLFVGNPAHHVVMNAGNGQIIEAPHTGLKVRLRALNPNEFTSAARYVNAVGNVSSLLNGNTASGTNTMGAQAGNSGGNIGGGAGTSELAAIMGALSSTGAGVPVSSQGNGSTNSSVSGGSTGAISTPTGNGQNDKGSLQNYAKQLLAKYGWAGEWNDFNSLVMSESGWDIHATNPSSGAYGIPQSLPGSKMASAGSDWKTNGDTQLNWMMSYIKGRYGDPSKAWSFHQSHNWYAAGAWDIDKDQSATVHAGEMIIPAKQAESIRQVLMNQQYNPGLGKSGSSGGDMYYQVTVNLPTGFTGTYQETQEIGKAIAKATADQTRIVALQKGQ